MAHTQGGLQDIKDISGVSQTMISQMQGTAPPYSFGDITRVGQLGQGGQTYKNTAYNADEICGDPNRVGLNPFNELLKGFSFTAIG